VRKLQSPKLSPSQFEPELVPGRCDQFSTRLSIRLMPLTGHPRQKRRWRNEFCGPRQMESLTQGR
jgi:hypothetical protein